MNRLKREDILYPELSYKVVGLLYNVHNEMGYGFLEKYYQKGIASEFRKSNIEFQEQVKVNLVIDGKVIGK